MNVTPLAIEKLQEVMEGEDESGTMNVTFRPAGSGDAGRPGFAVHANHGKGTPA